MDNVIIMGGGYKANPNTAGNVHLGHKMLSAREANKLMQAFGGPVASSSIVGANRVRANNSAKPAQTFEFI